MKRIVLFSLLALVTVSWNVAHADDLKVEDFLGDYHLLHDVSSVGCDNILSVNTDGEWLDLYTNGEPVDGAYGRPYLYEILPLNPKTAGSPSDDDSEMIYDRTEIRGATFSYVRDHREACFWNYFDNSPLAGKLCKDLRREESSLTRAGDNLIFNENGFHCVYGKGIPDPRGT